MNERDIVILTALDDLETQAETVGLCPQTFRALRREVMRIMGERDGARAALLETARMNDAGTSCSAWNKLMLTISKT